MSNPDGKGTLPNGETEGRSIDEEEDPVGSSKECDVREEVWR